LKLLLLVCISIFLIFVTNSMRVPYLPLFAREELGANIGELGLIAAVPPMITALLSTPFGLLSDRAGRSRLLLLGALTMAISTFTLALIVSPLTALVIGSLTGLAAAIIDPTSMGIVPDVVPNDRLGFGYALLTTSLLLGFAAGPIMGGLMVDYGGYRIAFAVAAAFAFIGTLAIIPLLKVKTRPTSGAKELALIFRRPRVWSGWSTTLLTFFTVGGVQVFLPLYVKGLGFDSTYVGFLVGILFIVGGIARLPFGILLNKPGLELRLAVLGLTMLAVPTFFMIGIHDTLILSLLVGWAGLGFGVSALVSNIIIAREVSENRGLAMGMNTTFRFVGLSLGPAIVAAILALHGESTTSYDLAFRLLSSISLIGSASLASLATIGWLRRRRSSNLQRSFD